MLTNIPDALRLRYFEDEKLVRTKLSKVPDDAIEFAQRWAARAPDRRRVEIEVVENPNGIAAAAAAHYDNGDYNAALEGFLRAAQLDDRDYETWTDLADTYLALEKYRDAVNCAEKALNLNRAHAGAYWVAARAEVNLNEFDAAIPRLKKILGLAVSGRGIWEDASFCPTPEDLSEFHCLLSVCYLQTSSFPLALQHSKSAIEFDNNNLAARRVHAAAVAFLGNPQECDGEWGRGANDAPQPSPAPSELMLQMLPGTESMIACLDALTAFWEGRYVEASTLASTVLGENQQHPTALFLKGACSLRLHRLTEALMTLARAAKFDPYNISTQMYWADTRFLSGEDSGRGKLWQATADALERAKRIPDTTSETIGSGQLALDLRIRLASGNTGDELSTVLVSNRRREDVIQDALIALKFNEPGLATAILGSTECSDSPTIAQVRTEALLLQKRFDEAATTIAPFTDSHADDYLNWRLLAQAELGRDRVNEATVAAGKGYELQPTDSGVVDIYARSCLANGEIGRAVGILQRFTHDHREVPIMRLQAELEERVGETISAIRTLRLLAEKEPEEASHIVNLSRLSMQAGDTAYALEILQKCHNVVSESLDAAHIRTSAYLESHQYRNVLRVTRKILRQRPGDTFSALAAASANVAIGHNQDAMRVLEGAHRANPKDVNIVERLASLYLDTGRVQNPSGSFYAMKRGTLCRVIYCAYLVKRTGE